MLKWTLRSSAQPGGRRAAPVTAHDIRPDARYSTDSSLRDSNKCWSETQVKVAQVKSTLKLTKENQLEQLYEENCDSLECSSNYSSSKTSRSSLRSNKSSTADAKEDKRRKKLSKNLRCATLIAGSASDSDASSGVYMQLHHTPVALLQPCGPSTGHDDPRRRPLIDVSNGDYDDVKKHLQNVYLKHPLAENCLLADSVQERAKTCNFSCIADSNALVTSEAETDTGSTPDVIGCHQEFIEEKEGMKIETHQEVTRNDSSEHGHDLRHDCRSVVSGGNGQEKSLGTAGTVRDDTEYRGRRPEPLGASVPSGTVDQQIPSSGKLRSSTRIEGFFKDVFRSAHNPRRSLRSSGATAAVTQSKPRLLPEDTSLLPRSSRPFVRDGPEGSSASKLELCSGETKINSLSSKRHSISVFPKEIFLCSVSSKKRLSSYGHKKLLQNRVYDIQIDGDNNDEPSSASHGDGEPKSVDNVNEEIKNSNCLESACTGGIRTRSTFCENALYMSMNGDDIILENSNRDIDTIYSSPKLFRCNDEGKSEANQRHLMHGNDTYVLMTNDRAPARLQSTCEMPRKTLHTSYSFPLLLPHRRLLHQPFSDAMVHEHTNAETAHTGSDILNSNPKRRSSESSELKTASPRGIRPIYPTPPSPSRRLINRQMLRHSAKDVVQSDIGSSATSCLGVRQTLVKPAELLPCKSCLVYGDLASPSCLCDIPRHDKNSSNRARSNEQSTALNSTSSKTKVSGEYNIDKGNDRHDYSRLENSSVSLNKPDCDSQSTSNQPDAAHQNNTEQITYSDVISRANGSSNRNLSVIIDRVVHKTLFDSESGSLLEAQLPAAILSRRHSISSSDNVSKELITGSNRCEVSFWNEVSDSSIHLPKFRKYPSESMLFHEYEVPLAASIDKILSQTQQSSFLDPDNRTNFPDLMVSFRQCGENRIRHVLARRKEAGTALPCPIVAGKQVISAQWLKTSSEADLFHTTPGNLTLELPEMGSEQLGTRNMTGASVPNTAARSEHVSECRELKKGTKEEGLLPASKTEEKLLQRQEESSYRLLRLFQDCSIDEVIESDDEDFDSGEWSMHATLDENSTRDPALLDLSCAMLNVDVMRDPDKLDSATVSVIEKLRAISDDKMLAKFRKSFRRKDKDKVDNNLSMFMFVDNPMYLSPEIKKEAKVVNSGFGGTSWFFSNPTYSSPNIIKSKVRSYTRPLSDSVQCEKENIKNLMLAQASSEPIWHQSSAPKVSLLQSNPCYQYSNAMRVSSSDDTQETLPGLAFSQEDINGDNILEHEYCTIPGDEESDSWITQSSGSQQANSSPSSKRHFPQSLSSLCLSSPQSRGRFVLTKDLALTSHNNLKEANCNPIHVYANGPTYNPCSTATTTLAAASYASPRTPRPVKKSCSLRQQFVFGEHPPTVPPPLPSRLRNSIRQSSWAPQELPSHGTFVSQESQSQCADNTHSIGDLRSNQERLDIHGSNTRISATKAFQLPPDGVYESIADAASRRSRSDSSSTNKRVDFESHSDASRVSLLGTCQGLSNGAFETQQAPQADGDPQRPVSGRQLTLRVPKTPVRRSSRPSFVTTPGTAKNALASLGRGRRTPSRRPQKKYRARDVLEGKGLLQLAAYENSGLLTIHIMEARKLKSRSSGVCNPYVKLSLVPDEVERTFCRTSVLRATNCPHFNQQFSFDFLPEDLSKRLLISLWNRDPLKKKSEFLGCMSFNVGHILSKKVHGWFRLLTEAVGRRKHFAAPPPSPIRPAVGSRPDSQQDSESPTSPRRHHQVSAVGASVSTREAGWGGEAATGQTPYTLSVRVPRGAGGFGFSVSWSRPPRVERVDAGLPAAAAGLLPGDYLIFVGNRNVVRMHEKEVMAAIMDSGEELLLEVYRKGVTAGPPSLPSRRSLFQQQPGLTDPSFSCNQQSCLTYSTSTAPPSQTFQTKDRRRWQSAEDNPRTSPSSQYYNNNYLLQQHAQLYPAILASPTRHHERFQQVTKPYLSAVLQV